MDSTPRLVVVQQPQKTFHKDEGGKQNTLAFRVILQGDIDPACGGSKGEIPMDVIAVFEDGTPVPNQKAIISITGCTEKPNGEPCLCLVSRLGGCLYRLKQVSKRLEDRAICVKVSLRTCPQVQAIMSEGTMVFSKRKDRTLREYEQAVEKAELERREAEAAQMLTNGRLSGSVPLHPEARRRFPDDDGDAMNNSGVDEDMDDDGNSSELGSSSEANDAQLRTVLQRALKRIAALERTVQNQQKAIDDMKAFVPAPPSMGNKRSISQAFWESRLQLQPSISVLHPPHLRRDISNESIPEFPHLERSFSSFSR